MLGVDLSTNMLARARRDTPEALPVTYQQADLDEVVPPPASFDLAWSALTLHYVEHLPRLLVAVHDDLVAGGRLVVSVEHPVLTAPSHPEFVDGPHGGVVWPLDGYHDEGPFRTDWLAPGVLEQHRTVATYVNALVEAGLVLDRLEEWSPCPADVATRPEWAVERHRPFFLLLAAHRP